MGMQTLRFAGTPLDPAADRAAAQALLDYQSPTAALIAQPAPFASRVVIWAITGLVACSLLVMGLVPVDRVVTAQGRVTADRRNIVIQPLEVSIVRSIAVKEGQFVRAGQLLARLDPTFATADSTSTTEQIASLRAETRRLGAELDGRGYRPAAGDIQGQLYAQRSAERAARIDNLGEQIAGARSQVTQARSDLTGYGQRLVLAQQLEDGRRQLAERGFGSRFSVLQATDSRVELTRNRDNARAALESAQRQMAALSAELRTYVQQRRAETSQQLSDAQRRLTETRRESDKAGLRRQLVDIRADRDGIVLNVAAVSVGSVLQSGDAFITLVPAGSSMEVTADVPGRDAGFLHVGDPVTIKFDGFDYRTYGTASGIVTTLSPDSFTQAQSAGARPAAGPGRQGDEGRNADAAFYRVRADLRRIALRGVPADFRPTPGMPVTIDIKVGQRTVLGYLFGRAVPALTEGMREP